MENTFKDLIVEEIENEVYLTSYETTTLPPKFFEKIEVEVETKSEE
jgi:hypothetical protein